MTQDNKNVKPIEEKINTFVRPYLEPLPPLHISPTHTALNIPTNIPSNSTPSSGSAPRTQQPPPHTSSSTHSSSHSPSIPSIQSPSLPNTSNIRNPEISPTSTSTSSYNPLCTIGTILITPTTTYSQLLSQADSLMLSHSHRLAVPCVQEKALLERDDNDNRNNNNRNNNNGDTNDGNNESSLSSWAHRVTYSVYRRSSSKSLEYSRAAVEGLSDQYMTSSAADIIKVRSQHIHLSYV